MTIVHSCCTFADPWFDIETLESKADVENMTNVDAVHRLASIAVGTSEGDSACFIRRDSSPEAAEKIVRQFIDYLSDINGLYEATIPAYFHEALDQIEILTSAESTLPKCKKMELSGLKSKLENYLILDVWGYNSALV